MEIRGVGPTDVPAIFGIRSVRQQKRIEVVVQLMEWTEDAVVERTGLEGELTSILGVELPLITDYLNPGKNITVIAAGPMRMIFHCDGSAARPKSASPHQKLISPK